MKRKLLGFFPVLIVFILIIFSQGYSQGNRFDSIRKGFGGGQSLKVSPKKLAGIIIGSIIFIMVLYSRHKQKTNKLLREESLKRYSELLRKYNLGDEKHLLDNINLIANNSLPAKLLLDRYFYETSISKYIRTQIFPLDTAAQQKQYAILGDVRKKIGFDKIRINGKIVSTKELANNKSVSLSFDRRKFNLVIAENREDGLYLRIPLTVGLSYFKAGISAYLSFYIEKTGHYRVRTRIIKVYPTAQPYIRIAHTYKIGGPKKRLHKRYGCRLRSEVKARDKNTGAFKILDKNGEIVDISEGGLQLEHYSDIPINTLIKLNFDADKKYFFNDLRVQIVSKTKSSYKYIYHMKYLMTTPELTLKLKKTFKLLYYLKKGKKF